MSLIYAGVFYNALSAIYKGLTAVRF